MAKTSTLKTLPDPSVADELTVIRSRREGLAPQIFDVDAIYAFKREDRPPPSGKLSPVLWTTAGAYGDDQCGVTARLSKLTSGNG